MTRAAVLLALAFALSACARHAGPEEPPEGELWLDPQAFSRVEIARAEVRELPQAVHAGGKIAFDDLHVTHVSSPVTGRITRLLAQPGQRVVRGTPLLAILSPDVGSAFSDLVKAHADLLLAEAEFDRQRRLAAVHAASQRDLEASQDAYRKAEVEYDRARKRAALLEAGTADTVTQEYTLRSPLEGEVVARNASPGLEVQGQYSGGQAIELFTVGDVRRVWAVADVAEADLPKVARGAAVQVSVAAYPGRTFRGEVEWISDTLDPALRTAKVRASIANDDEGLKPEMYAQVSIAVPPRRALAVPRAAVTPVGGHDFVYLDAGTRPDGRHVLSRRLVRIADTPGDLVEVTEGLSPGEPVVEEGAVGREASHAEAWVTARQMAAARIEVAPVQEQDVPDAVTLGGRLAFDDTRVTHVFSPVSGRITRVLARPGQRVKRGAPLAAILSPDVGAALADAMKADADLTQAQHELRRLQELYAAHAAARKDLEAAQDAFAKARAEQQRAREKTRLLREGSVDRVTQEYLVTAPIDGDVVARNVNPGAEVQGQYSGASNAPELFTIGDTSRLWVLADAFEVDLPRIHEGGRATLHVSAYPGRAFDATIDWISDVLDPQLRTAKVRCVVDNRERLLKPEMYEAVTVRVPGRKVLAVPRSALLRVGDDTVVFVQKGEAPDGRRRFEMRRVSADEGRAGGLVPVTGALRPGEPVVVRGAIFVLGAI